MWLKEELGIFLQMGPGILTFPETVAKTQTQNGSPSSGRFPHEGKPVLNKEGKWLQRQLEAARMTSM